MFIKVHDPIFHRTYYLNMMIKEVTTDHIAAWDADVIVQPEQVISALKVLRANEADIVYPYDGLFLDKALTR